ncbi:hypothetical protein LTR86_006456 [Recurvomyces mirabilis]|nr:hypothetical protein LTR86_006456 [Recurvomyces mirabilis]
MPPKRGQKRKTKDLDRDGSNNDDPLAPPNRSTWDGWVEMESEPAFFNVMLNEMDAKGVRVQEIYDMDDEYLLTLPHPVHALIFLFRYRENDTEQQEEGKCPQDVWFANQTPDYACATFALLNIVNNMPGLEIGDELRRFKDFTKDMDPLSRGDAIDQFDFVKHIHNSFASESDMLQTEMVVSNKAAAFRKKQAIAKGVATKAAKKAKLAEVDTEASIETANKADATRSMPRTKKPMPKKSPKESSPGEDDEDEDYKSSAKSKSKSPSSQDVKPTTSRRSGRKLQARNDGPPPVEDEEPDEGFHFVAYMPINGHVWKLDGLDRFPQDMGPYEDDEFGMGWMRLAQPLLRGRMLQYAESEIQFNCMAVVHDPIEADRQALARNVKALQTVGARLSEMCDEWWELEGGETRKDVITGMAPSLGLTLAEIEEEIVESGLMARIKEADDVLQLLKLRQEVIGQQAFLRASVRDAVEASKSDAEKARHRRHDYGSFVRGWLGALADQGTLSELLS